MLMWVIVYPSRVPGTLICTMSFRGWDAGAAACLAVMGRVIDLLKCMPFGLSSLPCTSIPGCIGASIGIPCCVSALLSHLCETRCNLLLASRHRTLPSMLWHVLREHGRELASIEMSSDTAQRWQTQRHAVERQIVAAPESIAAFVQGSASPSPWLQPEFRFGESHQDTRRLQFVNPCPSTIGSASNDSIRSQGCRSLSMTARVSEFPVAKTSLTSPSDPPGGGSHASVRPSQLATESGLNGPPCPPLILNGLKSSTFLILAPACGRSCATYG